MDKTEMAKLERYLRRLFANQTLNVTARAKKTDSAEVYVGDEFIGVLSVDDEDGDRSFSLAIAILAEDLQG